MALHKIVNNCEIDAVHEFNSMLTSDYFTYPECVELFYSEGMDKIEGDFIFVWNEYHQCYLLGQIELKEL